MDVLRAAQQAYAAHDLATARALAESGLAAGVASAELLHLAGCIALDQKRIDPARGLLAHAHALRPGSARIAYNLANACFAAQDYREAARHFLPALAWAPRARDAAFKIGYSLGRLRRWPAAAAALVLACRLGDTRGETAQGVGESARACVAAGLDAPDDALPAPRATGTISVVVCSIDPDKLARLRANLGERLAGEDWELVAVTDARSLCEGYARGCARARGDLIVLCHDDIRIISPDFAERLRARLAQFDLIGVAGTTLASGPSWGWSGPPHTCCWVSQSCITARLQHLGPATLLMGARGPVVPGAQLLDGVFLAARRSLIDRVGFDADTFDGFHFYDLDFSYRAYRSGARTAVCLDIALFHASAGSYDERYWHYADRYRRKFPEACTAPQHAPAAIPWMPLAPSDAQLLRELAWLRHWSARSDDALRADVGADVQAL